MDQKRNGILEHVKFFNRKNESGLIYVDKCGKN